MQYNTHSLCLDCTMFVKSMDSHVAKNHVIYETLIHPDQSVEIIEPTGPPEIVNVERYLKLSQD
jgi:hypothetical protein